MEEQLRENKMGIMPVGRLLITMSLPMMISMLIQALYNVVDSIFVAQLSENALTAVTLAFPIQNLMVSVGAGTAVGINALLSRSLGEKNFDTANKTAENGVLLAVLSSIGFTIFGVLISRPFLEMQTDVVEILEYGVDYLQVCSGFCFGIFIEMTFNRLLLSTGRTVFSMLVQMVGAVINIIMDPILIFGYGPFPAMGVTGAAVATVMGQIIAAGLSIFFNFKFNPEIKMSFRRFRPDGSIIKRIYIVGVPSILLSAVGSVTTFSLNRILMAFSSTATAVMGIYFKLQSFVLMPIFGLNGGLVPIISYNYGAKSRKRLTSTLKLAILLSICIMLVGLVLIQIFPTPILRLFNASDDMLSIGIPALRIISLSFVLAGFSIISISTFQALGNGVLSMMISFIRQLLVLLPAAWLLARSGNVNLIWWAFPIAELAAFSLCVFFLLRTYRKVIKPLGEVSAYVNS